MNIELITSSNVEKYSAEEILLEDVDILFMKIEINKLWQINKYLAVAKNAKQKAILSILIIIDIDKTKRQELNELKDQCDSIFFVDSKNEGIDVIDGIVGTVMQSGDNDINLDFSDLKTIMSYKGLALFGCSEFSGNCPERIPILYTVPFVWSRRVVYMDFSFVCTYRGNSTVLPSFTGICNDGCRGGYTFFPGNVAFSIYIE